MAERFAWQVVTTPDPKVIVNAFFTAAERCQRLDVPLKVIADRYSQEIAANFAAEGRPTGWAPLAETTIKDRISRGFAEGPILDRTGMLKGEATDPTSWEYGGSGQLATADLSVPYYGGIHNAGSANMPLRDWMYTPPEFDDEIDKAFLDDWAFEPLAMIP